jgi:hypothetical protein
LPEKERE